MKHPVRDDQRRRGLPGHDPDRFVYGGLRDARIQSTKGRVEPTEEKHVTIVLALGARLAGCDVGTVRDLVAEIREPDEEGFLDDSFIHDSQRITSGDVLPL